MSHKFFRRDSKTEKSVPNNGTNNNNNNNKKDFSERKTQLTPQEYRVTQERQTERPFSNRYNRHWESGKYNCIVCDAELFKSSTKFESKSGWPAFSNVVDPKRVKLTPDLSHIGANLLLLIAKPDLARTEVSCANCNAHLGHLFKDGPKPTGLRYCINSSSLHFVSTHSGENDQADFEEITTDVPPEDKAFPCNPANSCSMAPRQGPNENSAMDFQNNSVSRKSQTLPPMATLCLNNQFCSRKVPPTNTTKITQKKTELSHSTEAIPTKVSSNNYNNGNSSSTNAKSIASVGGNNNPSIEAINSESPLSRTSSSRFPVSSRGASLTAARISFFQNLTGGGGESKSNSGGVPSSRWGSGSISSITSQNLQNNTKPAPFANRFVNSISSGSLGSKTVAGKSKNENSSSFINEFTRRSSKDNNGLFTKNSTMVEKISSAPMPLKETSL